jgi:hypothetical protein
MEAKSQRPKGRCDDALLLNEAIDALDLVGDAISAKQAKDAFNSASVLLTAIRVGPFRSTFVGCRLTHAGLDDQQSRLC